MLFTIETLYKIIKWTVLRTVKSMKWFIRYIQFIKSGYSYAEVHNLIMTMNGREFEIFCFELLKATGKYNKVSLTKASADYGRDVILTTDEGQIFVECKHYINSIVGREICQKIMGSMQMFGAYQGIIMNTGKYHKNAYECANMVDNLILWDMGDIMKMVIKVNQKQLPKILIKALGVDSKIVRLNLVNE